MKELNIAWEITLDGKHEEEYWNNYDTVYLKDITAH